jgi:hypothetical protein
MIGGEAGSASMSKYWKRGLAVVLLILAALAGLLAYKLLPRERVVKHFAGTATGWTLANSASECKLPAEPLVRDHPMRYRWLSSYTKCLLALKPGKRAVVVIARESDIPNTDDAFGAVNIVLDLPIEMLANGISLPDPEIKVAYNACWGPFAHFGCEVGHAARGRIRFLPLKGSATEVEFDLAMEGSILADRSDKWEEAVPTLYDLPSGWIPKRVTGTARLSELTVTGAGQAGLARSGSRTLGDKPRR